MSDIGRRAADDYCILHRRVFGTDVPFAVRAMLVEACTTAADEACKSVIHRLNNVLMATSGTRLHEGVVYAKEKILELAKS